MLTLRRLPSTTAVPQLPREFLVSVGVQTVVPAVLAGAVTLVVYVGSAIYLVAKPSFPSKACLADGRVVAGVLIGENDSQTYLGDLSSAHPRRVLTIPAGRIETLMIGGEEAAIAAASCP